MRVGLTPAGIEPGQLVWQSNVLNNQPFSLNVVISHITQQPCNFYMSNQAPNILSPSKHQKVAVVVMATLGPTD